MDNDHEQIKKDLPPNHSQPPVAHPSASIPGASAPTQAGNQAVQRRLQGLTPAVAQELHHPEKGEPHAPAPAGLSRADIAKMLMEEAVRLAHTGATRLPADYVRSSLRQPNPDAHMTRMLAEGVAWVEAAQPGGKTLAEKVKVKAADLVTQLEHIFAQDPKSSSLDLLPHEQRQKHHGKTKGTT